MFNFGHPKLGKMCPKMLKIFEVQNLKELGFFSPFGQNLTFPGFKIVTNKRPHSQEVEMYQGPVLVGVLGSGPFYTWPPTHSQILKSKSFFRIVFVLKMTMVLFLLQQRLIDRLRELGVLQ
jgi:hypothetical protein